MSQQPELHSISLQYQVRTNKQGHREVERLFRLLGKLQNAAIRHRRLLGKAGVHDKEILRLQNAGITDLREHDLDFANIARRPAESVVKRVNDSYAGGKTVARSPPPPTEPSDGPGFTFDVGSTASIRFTPENHDNSSMSPKLMSPSTFPLPNPSFSSLARVMFLPPLAFRNSTM